MPRIFISHSSKDNFEALAMRDWLVSEGWAADDVFIDLLGIGAGARWKEALAKANERCEAVLFLVSPYSLASSECYVELRMAEDLGKVIMPVIIPPRLPEDEIRVEDERLAIHRERQVVDVSIEPRGAHFAVEHDGRARTVEFHAPTLARIKARLQQLGISPDSFAWIPADLETATPYPGLEGFATGQAALFFGRAGDIARGFAVLRKLRRSALSTGNGEFIVVQAASGAGKSSYLKAGLWPRLSRDAEFNPIAILRPATGVLTGERGVGRQFSAYLTRHGRAKPATSIHQRLAGTEDTALAELVDLINTATQIGLETLRIANPDALPPTPVIAVDQAEELFAAEDAEESQRFLRLLARLLDVPRAENTEAPSLIAAPLILWTIRVDSIDALLHASEATGLRAPEPFLLPPIKRDAYREIITEPIAVANTAGMRITLDPLLTDALLNASHGADALPLLAYTLRQLVEDNRTGSTAHLTLAAFERAGGIGGVLNKRLKAAQRSANASDEALRRLFVPRLTTWDRDATPPGAKRLVADEAGLHSGRDADLRPLSEALINERLLTRSSSLDGGATIEVAHEALLRQPPLSGWLENQKDALILRDEVLREAARWEARNRHDEDLLRRGEKLANAAALAADPEFSVSLLPAQSYLATCKALETNTLKRERRAQSAIYALLLSIIIGLLAFINQKTLFEMYLWRVEMGPTILSGHQERRLAENAAPEAGFAECKNGCPEMVVVPAGVFMMGWATDPSGKPAKQRPVSIAKPFAVSRTEITFAQWEMCVRAGSCPEISDNNWGRGDRPVIFVSWDEANQYAVWLSRLSGKKYRLLTGKEWEYAARAGSYERFSFGDSETELRKYAWYSDNAGGRTQPVGRKKPNAFGLYDVHGNVSEWIEDCLFQDFDAPETSKPRRFCEYQMFRGGSWLGTSDLVSSASGISAPPGSRKDDVGFRIARTLTP